VRRLAPIAAVLASALLLQAGPVERALAEAQQELARAEQLVGAGVAPRKQLDDARARFEEVQDEAVLAATLYAQVELNAFTPEMADSMRKAAGRRMVRRQAVLDEARAKADAGVLARTALTPLVEEVDRARRVQDEAKLRAEQFEELASMANVEAGAATTEAYDKLLTADLLPAAIRYDGKGVFNETHWRKVVLAFEKQFGHGLRVSAKGETAYHKTLGFDHRGRVDVALDPDSEEGVWLRQYLEEQRIPYFAYRRAVTGQASAAHIHLGPPSPRYES
jgi:hypothetical protein